MSNSVLRDRSKEFAKKIIVACRSMRKGGVDYALVNQLIRSGTSIGANLHEAQYAHGTKDFISKLEIALKECNETDYWLEIITDTFNKHCEYVAELKNECVSIKKMLIASINKLSNKTEL